MGMSIDRNKAHAAAIASLAAKQSAADAVFIASVNTQITTADKLGKTSVTAHANKNTDIVFLYLYFTNLGYSVYFPDYANQHAGVWPGLYNQPADLFGWHWVDFWADKIRLYGAKSPTRLTVSWPTGALPPTPVADALLLENGDFFELEDGSGDILLE